MFLLSTVVLAASIYLSGAYPGGAPSQACNNLTPGHVSSGAQTDAVPYVFDLSQFDDGNGGYEYTPGQSYTLTLSDPSGTMTFRGFLVQSRVVADSSIIVGTFAVHASNSKLSSCTPSNSAITHDQPSSRVDFTSMTMTWNAPPAGTGAIQFAYAVVRRNSGGINVFWADQRSSTLQEPVQVVQSSTTIVVQSSTTTDVQPSTTTDVQSSTTTDVQSSTTTDVQSSTTTDVQSSTTTDVQSSTTTDVQSSTTTDVQPSTTTDTPSSTTTTDAGTTPTPTSDGGDGTTGSASVLGTSLLFLLLSVLLGATLLL